MQWNAQVKRDKQAAAEKVAVAQVRDIRILLLFLKNTGKQRKIQCNSIAGLHWQAA